MNSAHCFNLRHAAFAAVLLALALGWPNPANSQQSSSAPAGVLNAPRAPVYTVLYDFPGASPTIPSQPVGEGVAQGRNGDLYSTTLYGGTDYGTVFSATSSGAVNLVNGTVGGVIVSGVTLGTDGNFYGTSEDAGSANCGQVYKVTPAGVAIILHTFMDTGDGCSSQAAPIEGTNGRFYGPTGTVGALNSTVYSVTAGGVFTTLHTFTGSDGQDVMAGLVQGADGDFYGVAAQGGANGYGDIFKMTPAGAVTVLYSFVGPDGGRPAVPLVQASDGNFYGTTSGGGTYNDGEVFQITPSGTFTVIHNLQASAGDGEGPSSALIQATDGNLYGVTGQGSSGYYGTIFRVTTAGTFTTLYNFCSQTDCTDGFDPLSPLIQNTSGILYGFTFTGGTLNQCGSGGACGVFYSLNVGLGPFVSLVSTSGAEGATVGILGQGFSASSVVKFSDVQATSVTVSGTKFINTTVPAGALTGSVTVTTGATTLTSNQKFRVTPVITSFTPPSGPVGTPVIITGSGLTQTTKVTFGGVAAATVTVNSDTQVTADVPTGAVTGKIAITTTGGTATSITSFTVN